MMSYEPQNIDFLFSVHWMFVHLKLDQSFNVETNCLFSKLPRIWLL